MKIILFIFLLLPVASLIFAEDASKEISDLLHKQDAAWNRGDLEGFVEPYDSSGQLVFIGADGPIRDRKVLKERYEKRYKTGSSDFGKLSFSDLQVETLSSDLARAWGRWEVDQKGKKLTGWFTLILKHGSGGWHIIHDHSSSD